MLGLGYGHPVWGHGLNHGRLKVEREDLVLADLTAPCAVPPARPGPVEGDLAAAGQARRSVGRGVFEQLALGLHAPSGFKSDPGHGPMSDLQPGLEAYLTDL